MNVLQPEDIRLLTEVGLLAAARADRKAATAIFSALERLRPGRAFPYAGQAMAQMNARQYDAAALTLQRGQQQVQGDDLADLRALRAVALRLAGRAAESEREARDAGMHPLARALTASPSIPSSNRNPP